MTKRDFQLIADVLRDLNETRAHCFDDKRDQLAIAGRFADALEKTNPRFDADRFIQATFPKV